MTKLDAKLHNLLVLFILLGRTLSYYQIKSKTNTCKTDQAVAIFVLTMVDYL